MVAPKDMSVDQFVCFQREFSDSFLAATYHAWVYSDDSWGEFLMLWINGVL